MMKAPMSSCQLRQIHKYHTDLAALINALDLAPFATSFTKSLSEKSLQTLRELSLVHVIRSGRDRYECVGGVRQLSLARKVLSSENTIPVLIHSDEMDRDTIQRRLLVGLYQQPALMGMSHGDTQMAKDMIERLKTLDESLLADLNLNSDKRQSYWSGVSDRTIQRG